MVSAMTDGVPVIDIGRLSEPPALRAIDAACREWGFFQVTGHGVDAALCSDLFAAARAFFTLPDAAKRSISRTADNPWGYFDRELTKNTRDWKQVYDYGPAAGAAIKPQWPAALPGFEAAIRRYYAASNALARRLLGALAVNLGVPPAQLEQGFGEAHTSFVRLNYYPACPVPSAPSGLATPATGFLGVNHHTDAGALTLLLQDDVPGLEVFREGRWHLVEPRRRAVVVNIGDIVQVWSNDRYRAALHRVLANAERERYSAPFFFNPSYDTHYAPLATTIDAGAPSSGVSFAPCAAPATMRTTARKYSSVITHCKEAGVMPFIETIAPAQAIEEVRAMYARQQSHWGFVPNYAKVFCHRPEVMARWARLIAEIKRPMDPRRYELATFAAALELRNSGCALAHGRALTAYLSAEDVQAVAEKDSGAGLTDAERAITAFARKVARDASKVTACDVGTLRRHGLSDAEIFDIAVTVAARAFFTKLLDGLGVEPDAPFLEMEPALRDALVVGRPIDYHAPEVMAVTD
jgi:uncharacterized peroxidase-related enzyme